jgi:hypothetical protein
MKLKKWCVVFSLLLVVGFAASLISQRGGRTSSATGVALAADMTNGIGATCNGIGAWHFVNNQRDGAVGSITATFTCGASTVIITATPDQISGPVLHFRIATDGDCELESATTGSVPGKLLLSDFACSPNPTPTPTPTPTVSPTPTVTPTPTPTLR